MNINGRLRLALDLMPEFDYAVAAAWYKKLAERADATTSYARQWYEAWRIMQGDPVEGGSDEQEGV